MYYLVKNFRDKSVTLRIKIYGESSSVRVVTPNNYYHEVYVMSRKKETSRNLERVNINGHLVPIDRSRKHHRGWETYWDDKLEGLQSVMEYLLDIFGIKKVTTIIVSPDTMRLLDVLKERQGNNYELYQYDRLTKVLRISGLSSNFPIGKYLQTIDTLCVGSKVSITLDDLLNMNCVELLLSKNRFTSTEIKRLLQHWAIGGLRRLKYLSLWVSDLNMEDVFGELTHTRDDGKERIKECTFHLFQMIEFD
ncbi:hypothetical protein CRE_27791 [Caenorhabditis remanei]|uniref:Sdz-33 F-box domain-containing protein n=1 Tax=Caenorhabditis remanei TaxID=31234 RepID=E3N5H6_CAERE|nr:hypothetical protein CRE_27791 [Caenorhabditis remanei]